MPLCFSYLQRLLDASLEPVTVGEVKAQLRLLHSDQDDMLGVLIHVARDWAEDFTSAALLEQTWVAKYQGWPAVDDRTFRIPRPPLIQVDYITYRDETDAAVELDADDYVVEGDTVRLKSTFGFPTLSKNYVHPVEIQFVAGYGRTAEEVPSRFKQAITLAVASAYGDDSNNARSKVPFRAPNVAEVLLAPLRVRPV